VELPFAPDEKLQRSLDKHLRQQRFRESLLGMLDEEERRVARIQEFLRDRRNQNALEDALTHLELPRAVNEGLLQRRLQTLAQSEFVKFAAGNFVSATLVAAKARESSVQLLQSLRAGVDKIKVLSEELSIGLKRCTDRVKAEKIKVGLA
jgi:phosphoribosyl-dephospho-CoA transferase